MRNGEIVNFTKANVEKVMLIVEDKWKSITVKKDSKVCLEFLVYKEHNGFEIILMTVCEPEHRVAKPGYINTYYMDFENQPWLRTVADDTYCGDRNGIGYQFKEFLKSDARSREKFELETCVYIGNECVSEFLDETPDVTMTFIEDLKKASELSIRLLNNNYSQYSLSSVQELVFDEYKTYIRSRDLANGFEGERGMRCNVLKEIENFNYGDFVSLLERISEFYTSKAKKFGFKEFTKEIWDFYPAIFFTEKAAKKWSEIENARKETNK